jgi:ABC-type uncharacterized transport system permease subunit
MMIMGAVTGFAAAFKTGNVWAGVITGTMVGGLLALIHAFLTITLRADQTVSGLTLTLFGSGLASFLSQRLGPNGTPQLRLQAQGATIPAAFLNMMPYVFTTILVLVIITWWEAFSRRVGAPAALGLPYMREEKG